MTERERWTVYPLLFLALGVSLKDKLTYSVNTKNLRCQTMVCNELAVIDTKGIPRVSAKLGALQAENLICRALVVPDAKGKSAVLVSSNQYGGSVSTLGAGTGITCMLGNADVGKTERIAGLMFVEPNGVVHKGQVFSSPLPVKPPSEDRPAADKAEQPEPTSDETKPEENNEGEAAQGAARVALSGSSGDPHWQLPNSHVASTVV